MPWSTRWTLARGASAGNSWTIVVLIISDRAPATSTPVGPPPTTTKSMAPSSARRGSRVGLLEGLDDPRLEAVGVVERVEREGVLRPGRPEEVRLRAGGEDEVVAGVGLARRVVTVRADRIDGHDLGALRIEPVEFRRDLAQRIGDVAGRQHRCRDLVEERLELVVVVLVDEGDVEALARGELAGAGDAGEPAADDDDACRALARRVIPRSEKRGAAASRPASAGGADSSRSVRRLRELGGRRRRSRGSPGAGRASKRTSSCHGRTSTRDGLSASSTTARMTSSIRSRA